MNYKLITLLVSASFLSGCASSGSGSQAPDAVDPDFDMTPEISQPIVIDPDYGIPDVDPGFDVTPKPVHPIEPDSVPDFGIDAPEYGKVTGGVNAGSIILDNGGIVTIVYHSEGIHTGYAQLKGEEYFFYIENGEVLLNQDDGSHKRLGSVEKVEHRSYVVTLNDGSEYAVRKTLEGRLAIVQVKPPQMPVAYKDARAKLNSLSTAQRQQLKSALNQKLKR